MKAYELLSGLLAKLNELRQLYLANTSGPLTVREGQLLGMCRVCRTKPAAPFIMNYGDEFAHHRCITAEVKP